MENIYWATRSREDIGDELVKKVGEYFRFLSQSGRLQLYERMYCSYYGPGLTGANVQFGGEKGELVLIKVNDLRNLLKHLQTLVTSQRLAYECRATNTDHKSQAQTILAKGLIDYYLREKEVEEYMGEAVETALVYAEGFISTPWNAVMGEVFSRHPETGAPIREGDIDFRVYSPMEMVREFTATDHKKETWAIPIDWVNKFDLAAKFPEFEETILNMSDTFEFYDGIDFHSMRKGFYGDWESDQIPLFRLYHARTDALPEGREVVFLSDGTVLIDEPIAYKRIPVRRISCSRWLGTIFGYTTGYDLLPIEEMTDSLHSSICTNANAFATQNVWGQKGDTPEIMDLAGGMRLLLSKVKPEALNLSGTAAETFKYLEGLGTVKETISGINNVARGQPERDMSGSAMALLQTTAIMFSQDLQNSFVKLFEGVGTDIIERLQTFANVPRVAAIAGKSKKKYMAEFTADDLKDVNRVLVDMGNPVMNTAAGKQYLAETFLERGLIETVEQFTMVLTTGQVEPLFESDISEMMLIRSENEMILEGQIPQALITDNPLTHIKEHKVTMDSPEARKNPAIMKAGTEHIQMHIDLWRGKTDPMTGQQIPGIDPDLAAMLGLPPPPNPMAMMGMQDPQGAPMDPTGGAPMGAPPPSQPPQGSGQSGPKTNQPATGPKSPRLPPNASPQAQQAIDSMGVPAA